MAIHDQSAAPPPARLAPVPIGPAPPFIPRDEEPADRSGLLDYWRIAREYKWSILAVVVMAAVAGALTALASTPIYRADARLLVQYNQRNYAGVKPYDGTPEHWLFYETQHDIIRSRAIAGRVVDKLDLVNRPEPAPRAGPGAGWRASVAAWIPDWREWLPEEWRRPPPEIAPAAAKRMARIDEIRGGLTVEGGENSQIIQVSYESSDPEMAARVVNAVADAYVEFGLESRLDLTRKASRWLSERIDELRKKVTESETALQEFQRRAGMVDSQSRDTMLGAKLGSLSTELIKAQARRSEAEARYREVRKASQRAEQTDELGAMLDSPLLLDAHRNAVERARRVVELAERYGEKHPKLIAARAEEAQASRRLKLEVTKAVNTVRKEYEVARAQESELRRIIARQQAEMRGISGKAFTLAKLEREVKANRDLYGTFMERYKEMKVANDYDVTNVRVIDAARVPTAPAKPNKRRMVVVAIILGLLAGLLLAVLRDFLDDTFRTRRDVERKLGLPVLGVLPRLRSSPWRRARIARKVLAAPQSAFAEAVNDVRTAILLSGADGPSAVIMVTSAVAGEGKTTFASNLAIAFGHRGRTLLLDADLRRGKLHENVAEIRAGRGLTDVVTGECTLQQAVLEDREAENLFIMAAGTLPPNPLEILSSRRFSAVLDGLRKAFDYIVVDASPVLPVSDSIILGHLVDRLVLTVQADRTTHVMARDAVQRLEAARLEPIGVVLQQVDLRKMRRYAGGYPDYYSAYYGYQGADAAADR